MATTATATTAAAMIPVRLLSSVAVVGRDNEPIYLRGDLCDAAVQQQQQQQQQEAVVGGAGGGGGSAPGPAAEVTEDDDQSNNNGGDAANDLPDEDEDAGGDGGSLGNNTSRGGRGLLGRIKGAVSKKSNDDVDADESDNDDDDDDNIIASSNDVVDEEDDDPFGFFSNGSSSSIDNNNASDSSNSNSSNSSSSGSSSIPAMSLTQQLVLHASLDRFEEIMANSRSNKGGAVRWRTPGASSNASNNAMWMGLLCTVEERWNVYGYLTNTGIKFMILVENVSLDGADGRRRRRRSSSGPPGSFGDGGGGDNSSFSSSSMSPGGLSTGGGREGDLKKMFARVHELYVRHTMNPFSKLRSPIRSGAFDRGIVRMAREFNGPALEQALDSCEGMDYTNDGVGGGGGGVGGGSTTSNNGRSNGLVWM